MALPYWQATFDINQTPRNLVLLGWYETDIVRRLLRSTGAMMFGKGKHKITAKSFYCCQLA
jgi:hypothetical protein